MCVVPPLNLMRVLILQRPFLCVRDAIKLIANNQGVIDLRHLQDNYNT